MPLAVLVTDLLVVETPDASVAAALFNPPTLREMTLPWLTADIRLARILCAYLSLMAAKMASCSESAGSNSEHVLMLLALGDDRSLFCTSASCIISARHVFDFGKCCCCSGIPSS